MNKEQLKSFLINETSNVAEALQQIDANAKGILFALDESGKLAGSVTDGDIRRWLIKTADLKGRICEIMNKIPKVAYHKDMNSIQQLLERYQITSLPVISTEGYVIDIVFRDKEISEKEINRRDSLSGIPVVIMAGGKGTRLYPYTKILPKPLIPIGDIPIMERIIDRFKDYGVQEFYATLNYKKSMIKSYFSETEKDYHIIYVVEEKPLGTGGSLHLIQKEFKNPIVVTNCDILIHADYSDIYKHHIQSGNDITIVSALKNILVPYGVLHCQENGSILSMEEKPKLSYFVNTGMYVVNPEVIKQIPEDTFYHMTDLAKQLLDNGQKVGMYPISEDSFLDMGEFEEMSRMEEKLNLKAE